MQTFWNGEPCHAVRGTAICVDDQRFPEYWARSQGLIGIRVAVVWVLPHGSDDEGNGFYLYDGDESAWRKITEQRGSPHAQHSSITVDEASWIPAKMSDADVRDNALMSAAVLELVGCEKATTAERITINVTRHDGTAYDIVIKDRHEPTPYTREVDQSDDLAPLMDPLCDDNILAIGEKLVHVVKAYPGFDNLRYHGDMRAVSVDYVFGHGAKRTLMVTKGGARSNHYTVYGRFGGETMHYWQIRAALRELIATPGETSPHDADKLNAIMATLDDLKTQQSVPVDETSVRADKRRMAVEDADKPLDQKRIGCLAEELDEHRVAPGDPGSGQSLEPIQDDWQVEGTIDSGITFLKGLSGESRVTFDDIARMTKGVIAFDSLHIAISSSGVVEVSFFSNTKRQAKYRHVLMDKIDSPLDFCIPLRGGVEKTWGST